MTNSLIEKVARCICRANCSINMSDDAIDCQVENGWDMWEREAKAALAAVLDHFSDQANVTDKMAKAVCDEGADNYWRERIAAAMKAAKEELK